MTPTLAARIHDLLDEADRLDAIAATDPPKPPPVASIHDMTDEWVCATLGPAQLRATAQHLRTQAANLARSLDHR